MSMNEDTPKATLWLAWYVDGAGRELPGWPLHLKMLYASSEEEAQREMQHWLEQKGQEVQNLKHLAPSPYGFQFQAADGYKGQGVQNNEPPSDLCEAER